LKTLALRLYGKNDLRLEEFELPRLGDNELLADITTNSICMSSYKALIQGADHKRVPDDVSSNPIIIGHEFCGTILEVGRKVKGGFRPGDKYGIQPAFNIPGRGMEAPGYSFPNIGGHATKIIIPKEALERDCLLPYRGDGFFKASLSEPVSCIIGAFNTSYHYARGTYTHSMGIREKGNCAILAGAGPMGLGTIDYALHGPTQPRLLVVTDIDSEKLDRASRIFPKEEGERRGVLLRYVDTSSGTGEEELRELTGREGYDDIFVFAPVSSLVEQASRMLAFNGCLNFFAGPARNDFTASVNFYDVHYSGHHVVGSSGGNTQDMKDALELMAESSIDPAVMITHVGGLNSAADTLKDLPRIPGGKKLIYTQIAMPLTALTDFERLGANDPFFRTLAVLVEKTQGLWSTEAEEFLLREAPRITSNR
jgi:threonine dehydrogenase-like Zn-dependent dehydrogenase